MFASEMKPGAYVSFSTIQGHHGGTFPLVPVVPAPNNIITPNPLPTPPVELLAGTFSITVVLPVEFLKRSGWTSDELTAKLQQLENDSLRLAQGWISSHLQEKGTIVC